jgi:hypothetical protein
LLTTTTRPAAAALRLILAPLTRPSRPVARERRPPAAGHAAACARSPKSPFCHATAADRGHVSGLRHLPEQVRGGDVGERIGLPGAGDGDGEDEDDGHEADERGEDEDPGAHALLLSRRNDARSW